MKFGDILRELIEDSDLTQKQFAAELHIPVSTVGGYVQGTSEPDFSTLLQIADYLALRRIICLIGATITPFHHGKMIFCVFSPVLLPSNNAFILSREGHSPARDTENKTKREISTNR